jgi:hypothetical protein
MLQFRLAETHFGWRDMRFPVVVSMSAVGIAKACLALDDASSFDLDVGADRRGRKRSAFSPKLMPSF